jgi:hypothetical protein
MTARKRREKKNSKKKDIKWIRIWPFILGSIIFLFLIYRIFVLISFKVNCSNIPTDMLSKNNSLITDVFIFENEEKITSLEIIIYSQDQKKLLKINIPTSIYVTEDGVDSYPISSMNAVGEFLEHGLGKEYTVNYLSSLLGLKFDNYVWLTNNSSDTTDFLSKLSIWSILFDFKYNYELKDNLYSNLPILNLIEEVNFINQISSNYQFESVDILDCCIDQFVISGSRKEVRFNTKKFDSEITKYIKELVSKEVERERVNVEVYNASDVSGLASEYARKIRHTGCRILRYDNSPNLYESTVIYVPELEGYENSLSLVRDVVGENIEIIEGRPKFITTGDIVVVLGKDLSK